MRKLLKKFKKATYFLFAHYLAFWAKIVLKRWQPRVIAITGSVGKTGLMHLMEAQLGDKAVYTHKANSAYGIPMHLLDLLPENSGLLEQIKIFILAPFKIFRYLPEAKIYIVEADSDRPGEGYFIGKLVKPEVVVWISSDLTHSWNFGDFKKHGFDSIEAYIAYTFGELVRQASKQIVLLNPTKLMESNVGNSPEIVKAISTASIKNYSFADNKTSFEYKKQSYSVPAVIGKEQVASVISVLWLLDYLAIDEVDKDFSKFVLPPGRSSIFNGLKSTTLIDGTYNIDILSLKSVLQVLSDYNGKAKWAVIGDMTEKGSVEEQEHQKMAELINHSKPDQLILYGRRTNQYTLQKLQELGYKKPVESFLKPQDVVDYLNNSLVGGEVILFKGAGFLEGVVEKFLANPSDAEKLCRREPIWQKRRAKWGL